MAAQSSLRSQRAALAALVAASGLGMPEVHAQVQWDGQVRAEINAPGTNTRGPLAQAIRLQPGIAKPAAAGAALESELRANGHGLGLTATARTEKLEGDTVHTTGWINEAQASISVGSWSLSAGKKIVAWDVGYGFRPNDVVQQEARRTLLTVTATGRPLVMAEYFDADNAAALVWVNPTATRDATGAQEPALAARLYRRDGAVDWHLFARVGQRTGLSLGLASAWVASDALELHASVRTLNRADTLALRSDGSLLSIANPWQPATAWRTQQAAFGGTWTNAAQFSLLLEAWWDGTAPTNAQWNAWNDRNRQLLALAKTPAPTQAIAGNLAWQTTAFNASTNLRQTNVFARASLTQEHWQPALDVLFTPEDGGRIITASVGWQGDRVRWEGGYRAYGGADNSIIAQLPNRRVGYLAATWAF